MRHPSFSIFVLASLLVVAGCGGPPGNNPLLEDARSQYESARNNPQIVQNAPSALQDAEAALSRGEDLWRDDADADLIAHQVYIAKQQIKIAEVRTQQHIAEEDIEEAELARKEVLLEAREQEATESKAKAREAGEEAREADLKAELAEERADEKAKEAALAQAVARSATEDARALADKVAELEARESERGLVLTLSDIMFDVDKATLKPGAQNAIDQLAAFLDDHPERKLLIEGHTDDTGTDSYNLDLSQQRADAVRDAIVSKGIPYSRIRTIGFGEQHPVATNDTVAGRQQNRRVDVLISNESGEIPDR